MHLSQFRSNSDFGEKQKKKQTVNSIDSEHSEILFVFSTCQIDWFLDSWLIFDICLLLFRCSLHNTNNSKLYGSRAFETYIEAHIVCIQTAH